MARARPFARRGVLHLRGGRAAVASLLPFTPSGATYARLRSRGQPTKPAPPCTFLIADRVSLRTAGATLPVVPWLPSEWRDRLARPDGLLRADCRAAFGYPVHRGDPEHLDAATVGRFIPRTAFLIHRSEYRKLYDGLVCLRLATRARSLSTQPRAVCWWRV